MRAPVNVFGVPDDSEGLYHIRNWLRVPLFTCTLEIKDTAIVEPRLPITLEKKGELIAQSFYGIIKNAGSSDGSSAGSTPGLTARTGINSGTSGVTPVGGSTKHFVLTIEKGRLRALVGIAFIDRSDAIDFSYLLHEFARRRVDVPVVKKERKTWDAVALPSDSKGQSAPVLSPPVSVPAATPTLVTNDLSDSNSDSDFGDFQ